MQTLILILHVLACLILVAVVLLQAGKEGMGVIFGGGSSSLFGSSGAGGLLVKITTIVAIIFLATSLGYNILTKKPAPTQSVMEVPFEEQQSQPANGPAPLKTEQKDLTTPKGPEATAPAQAPAAPDAAKETPAKAQ